jgi:16S rRNA (adenine1518-N6/adenine1519-N6)-dimethyltransferase
MSKVLNHQPRKRFGQNFLIDEGIVRRIVRCVGPGERDLIVEIGPGQGAITGLLIDAGPRLHVVELDRDLIPMLRVRFDRFPGFSIHEADALKFDFTSLAEDDADKMRVVGNLPYNISTPLIFHLLEQRQIIEDMHFMLQKEVVLRLAAKPGEKNYGRLSVMAQYFCSIEDLFDVPPECFNPAPKVMSSIVRLTPHEKLPSVAKDPKHFESLVKMAFQQRRKTLRNALKSMLENIDNESLSIDLGLRAERLDVKDFVTLSDEICTLQ